MLFLLAPGPGIVFSSMPSGVVYTADYDALVRQYNGSVPDQLALQAAGCIALTSQASAGSNKLRNLSGNVTADASHNIYEFSASGQFRVLTSLGATTVYTCIVRNKTGVALPIYLDSFLGSPITIIPASSDGSGTGYAEVEIDTAGAWSIDGNLG